MVLQVWKDTYYKLYNYPVLLESSTDYYFSYSNIIHNCLDTSMLNEDITLKEVERVIAQAPSKKSCGPDNIYADHFKNLKLFSSDFSKLCHKAIILPISKSGNTCDPLNYRGIALQCNLLKVYTSILNYRINMWLECNDILAMEQFVSEKVIIVLSLHFI